MSPANSRPPGWRLEQHDIVAHLRLTGDWIDCETGIRSLNEVHCILDQADEATLRVDVSNLGQWDSALIAFLKMLHESAVIGRSRPVRIDDDGLPDAARRLLGLASARTDQATGVVVTHKSLVTRVDEAYFDAWSRALGVAALAAR
jgi:phospholipid/cholesterol/gamma-HCH transport system permease protein